MTPSDPRIQQFAQQFAEWLSDQPAPSAAPSTAPPIDLHSLVAQFSALRHDVNLQTKATRAALDKLATPAPAAVPDRSLLESLLDMHDLLSRAETEVASATERLQSLEQPSVPTATPWYARLLRRPTPSGEVDSTGEKRETILASLADGYRLSLRRVERALTQAQIEPIATVGEAFDAECMEAVGLAAGEPGEVIREVRRGYRQEGQLIRTAQVIVGRE